MEEDELHWGEGGSRPLLLDLISHKDEWVVRGRGGTDEHGVEDEEKLELRLGPPGGQGWTSITRDKRVEDPSFLSFILFPFKNTTAGAKRGFTDTIQSQTQGNLHEGSRVDVFEQEIGNEKKVCSNQSLNAARDCNTSPSRNGAAQVVGWPPIRSFRKNLTSGSTKQLSASRSGSIEEEKEPVVRAKSLLVKINMDGIPIGRKVDLMSHCSYKKLSIAVDELFRGLLAAQRETSVGGNHNVSEQSFAITGLLDGSGEYTLVYEDDVGDRMLVGDVPWDMFVSTVKRLRVSKTSELHMLSHGFAGNRGREGVKSNK